MRSRQPPEVLALVALVEPRRTFHRRESAMVAAAKVVHVEAGTKLDRLLREAIDAPVLLEKDGTIYRLAIQPGETGDAAAGDSESLAPRGDFAPFADYPSRLQAQMVQANDMRDDSTVWIRESRVERTAQLLRASGSFSRDDPVWWEVARMTLEHFIRARHAIFGDRQVTDDSTEILRREREVRASRATGS
jgi:hypothetical protein